MKRYGKHNATTARTMYLRKHIASNRTRAKIVGLLYLLGIIVLGVAACLPMFVHNLAMVTPEDAFNVWKHLIVNLLSGNPIVVDMVGENYPAFSSATGLTITIGTALYTVMLIAVVINVIRALCKLEWLFTGKGNKDHGFNRNVFAMEDMGRLFSGSFAFMLITYFVVGVLCGDFVGCFNESVDFFGLMSIPNFPIIVLAVAVAIHFVCGFVGAKARYYDIENGQIVEQKRLVGRLACSIRNVLQIAVIAGVLYFFDFEGVANDLGVMLGSGGSAVLVPLAFYMQLALVLFMLVLIKHATALTEYSMEGIYGNGMKNFRVFAFLGFVVSAVALVMCVMNNMDYGTLLNIAAILLGAFVIELVLRKYPRLPETIAKGRLDGAEAEFSFETFNRLQQSREQNDYRHQNATYLF